MKAMHHQLLVDAVSALRGYLDDVPFCALESEPLSPGLTESGVDWAGRLLRPDGNRLLIMRADSIGQPRVVRSSACELLRCAEKNPDAIPVFAAPYISRDSADLLAREGVSYLDLAGNCRLVFDRVYIRRDDWPNQRVQRRDLRSLYSPKAERILRVLLLDVRRVWKVQALAEAAEVSLGQVSNVKRLLEDREWVEHTADGIILAQPGKLLAEWAQNHRFARNTVHDFYSLDSPSQVESKLASACRDGAVDYALTGFSAAARMAPMVRYERAMAYIAGSIDDIARRLELKPVSSGANVSLVTPYDAGVLAGGREIGGVRAVSPVQAYLDLLSIKGRGAEAAQAVLEQVIQPSW